MGFPEKQGFEYECTDCEAAVTMEDVSREDATATLLSLTPWTTVGDWTTFRCPECSLREYRGE
jgi:DNA-directed RNA polymerase subunit RPC12/RpoP